MWYIVSGKCIDLPCETYGISSGTKESDEHWNSAATCTLLPFTAVNIMNSKLFYDAVNYSWMWRKTDPSQVTCTFSWLLVYVTESVKLLRDVYMQINCE